MMTNIDKALQNLDRIIAEQEHVLPIPYDEFLSVLASQPSTTIRNVFQLFYDMIMNYVGTGTDEYPDDPETINYVHYDTRRLFVDNSDQPFFADRLFTNRLDPDADPAFGPLRDLRVSAHFLIRRDGELVQFVDTDLRAWHAGVSCFDGRERCNDFSVGIELEGTDEADFDPRQYATLNSIVAALRKPGFAPPRRPRSAN